MPLNFYRRRLADPLIADLLREVPALGIVGPRASGKTTTAQNYAGAFLRLDREGEARAIAADPDAALDGLREPILIDEWQEAPAVLGAVKRACDVDPRPGRFILTGSVRAELESQTWPGTGRVTRLAIYPMTIGEQLGSPETPLVDRIARGEIAARGSRPDVRAGTDDVRDYVSMALRGGFPQPDLGIGDQARRRWLDSYVNEIVSRDSQLGNGNIDTTQLSRYFEAYALNSAGVVPDTSLLQAVGINRRTAQRYHHLLGRLHIVDELPPWTSNRLKRLTKTPKRMLVDPSLLGAVTGAGVDSVMRDSNLLGRLLETFAVAQLRAQATVSEHRCRLYHLRQQHGRHEIDVVAELGARRLVAFEIKATAAPRPDDAKHLAWLRDQTGNQFTAGVVLHTGPGAYPIDDRLWALPLSTLWT